MVPLVSYFEKIDHAMIGPHCTITDNCHLSYIIQFCLDGLMQERHNSIANALELRLSGTNPSICGLLPSAVLLSSCKYFHAYCESGSYVHLCVF